MMTWTKKSAGPPLPRAAMEAAPAAAAAAAAAAFCRSLPSSGVPMVSAVAVTVAGVVPAEGAGGEGMALQLALE